MGLAPEALVLRLIVHFGVTGEELAVGELGESLAALAERAPAAAIAAAESMPDGAARTRVQVDLVRALATADPDLAIDFLEEAVPPAARENAATALVGGWSHHDLEAATRWAEDLEAAELSQSLLERLQRDWGELGVVDPAARE
jgi:hypothetical protein